MTLHSKLRASTNCQAAPSLPVEVHPGHTFVSARDRFTHEINDRVVEKGLRERLGMS